MALNWTHDQTITTDVGRLLYAIKEKLKACGWTTVGSGDGGANFSSSGGDVITSSGSGVNGYSNNSAWWQGTKHGFSISLQRGTNTVACAIFISEAAGFTGGSPSATRRMPATDELATTIGGGTDAAPTYNTFFSSSANRRWHLGAEDAADRVLLIVFDYDSITPAAQVTGLVIDDRVVTLSDDPSQLAIIAGGNNPWASTQWATTQSAWFQKGLGGGAWVRAYPHWLRGGSVASDALPQALNANPWNGKKQIFPMWIARRAGETDPDQYKGIYSCVAWIANDLGSDNPPYTLNVWPRNRSHIVVFNVVFPWDGTTPSGEAGNFDAEWAPVQSPGEFLVNPLPQREDRAAVLRREMSMEVEKVPRVFTGLPAVDRALEHLRLAVNKIISDPHHNFYEAQDLVLQNEVATRIPHRLGRRYQGWYLTRLRFPTGSGYLEEVVDDSLYDRSKEIVLRAVGYGTSITVNLRVF